MWRKSLKSSAIYSTKSKIENLKMTITLRTVSSLLKLEKFNLNVSNSKRKSLNTIYSGNEEMDENENNDTNENDDEYEKLNKNKENPEYDDSCTEKIELEWQQKVFSRYEIEYYKDIQNCITDLQKEYHEWIIRDNLFEILSDNGGHQQRIFTYVDSDNFIPIDSDDLFPQRCTEKETTLRAQKYSHPYTKSKVMYIYADLNPDTQLFMLRWLENEHMLIVYPDFNDFNHNPYFIEIDSDYRHIYSYAVDNISSATTFQTTSPSSKPFQIFSSSAAVLGSGNVEVPPISTSTPLLSNRKDKFFKLNNDEGYQQQHQQIINEDNDVKITNNKKGFNMQMQKNLSSIYDMPLKKHIRCNFLFNIKNAQEFEYNNLHVRYYIKLPTKNNLQKTTTKLNKDSKKKLLIIPDIRLETGNLNGTTHSSVYKLDGNVYLNEKIKIWNFSYAFQISLLIREKEFGENNGGGGGGGNSLRIYFELISIDSWQRERNEGYCFVLIPIKPGARTYNLNCYRPDYGFKDRIERFFIGGRKIFDFENFNSTENLENFLNRFQTKCITTGILNFSSECIFQRNPDEFSSLLYETDEIKRKSVTGMTLNDVMKAYQEARKRLEATQFFNLPPQSKDETEV